MNKNAGAQQNKLKTAPKSQRAAPDQQEALQLMKNALGERDVCPD